MDAYMGSGYRSGKAKEQARAVKEPVGGFLQPGFPVEVAPPPPPVAPPLAPVGGAAAAAAGFPLSAAAAFGIGLGWWATSEVREWKRGHYKRSPLYRGYPEYDPLYSFNQEIDLSKRYVQDLFALGNELPTPADFYAPDDRHGPAFYDKDGFYHWWTYVESCPANPGPEYWVGQYAHSCAGVTNSNVWGTTGLANCATLLNGGLYNNGRAFHYAGLWVCPDPNDPQNYGVQVGGYTKAGLNQIKAKECWLHHTDFSPDGTEVLSAKAGYARLRAPLLLDELVYPEYERTHWADWVAPPGTQPSGPDYVDVPNRGHTVPFSLRHRFTRVVNGGPGAVTVPDQVIDPDTGGVTVEPPGSPPDFPSPDEVYEKKPDGNRKWIRLGLTTVNAITETQDFMEALHQGLPKRLRSKGRKTKLQRRGDVPPWQIARDIIDHWDEFDGARAMEALINNEIEDRIYGRAFGAISRTQRKAGITAGFRRGAAYGHPVELEVPEVHFADGGFSVSFGSVTIGE